MIRTIKKNTACTIDNEIKLFSAIYHLAVKRKKISADLMPGEFLVKEEINPRRILSDKEFEKILKHTEGDFKDLLICGYESAMRFSEITTLTSEQVTLNLHHFSGTILDYIDLGIFDTKTGASRTVPISDSLKAVLQRRVKGLDAEDLIFTNVTDKRWANSSVQYKLKTACKQAKIPYGDKIVNKKGERIGVVFHCLRHTRTTRWVEMGFSDEIIRRATGHKSLKAYQNYVKLDPHVVMRLVNIKNLVDKTDTKSVQTPMISGTV
jgi:integrase